MQALGIGLKLTFYGNNQLLQWETGYCAVVRLDEHLIGTQTAHTLLKPPGAATSVLHPHGICMHPFGRARRKQGSE